MVGVTSIAVLTKIVGMMLQRTIAEGVTRYLKRDY